MCMGQILHLAFRSAFSVSAGIRFGLYTVLVFPRHYDLAHSEPPHSLGSRRTCPNVFDSHHSGVQGFSHDYMANKYRLIFPTPHTLIGVRYLTGHARNEDDAGMTRGVCSFLDRTAFVPFRKGPNAQLESLDAINTGMFRPIRPFLLTVIYHSHSHRSQCGHVAVVFDISMRPRLLIGQAILAYVAL